jgi:hypothetical protein
MSVNIKNMVFWDVTPCIPVVSYQCFHVTCCLHLQGARWRQHFSPKCWYLAIKLHRVTSLKTMFLPWECYLYSLSDSNWLPWWSIPCCIISHSMFWCSIAQVNIIFVLLVVQLSHLVISIVRHRFSVWYSLFITILFESCCELNISVNVTCKTR